MLQTCTCPKGKNISLPPESICLLHQLLPLGKGSVQLNCVRILLCDPTPASLGEPSSRLTVSSGHPSRDPSGKDVDSPAVGGEICLLRLPGSWEVEVSSWLGWHPLANRLIANAREREPAQPKIENQPPSPSC